HVGPRQGGHEALHEGAVRLVDHALRLGGDGVEHQRALAGAGDSGEDREPALRDLDADVLEVVLARPVHPDQVVAVSGVPVALGGLAHGDVLPFSTASNTTSARTPQRSSWTRIRLPAGSRKAQSRMPYRCSIGSWIT